MTDFNTEQLQAIEFGDGHCIVSAPAGSGKTRCLTHRIVRLLDRGVLPDQILSLTFTKAAAESMKNRLAYLVTPEQQLDLNVGTIHSLCWAILRDSDKNIAKAMASQQFLLPGYLFKNMLDQFLVDLGSLYDFSDTKLAAIKSAISLAKNHLITPYQSREFFRTVSRLDSEMLQEAFIYCENERLRLGKYDQDDVLVKTFELLQDKVIRRRWASKYRYLLVDEAQDTTPAQFKIIEILGQHHGNIMLVGDMRQSIYGFRGAAPSAITDFAGTHKATVINLVTNYRSNADIVAFANDISLFMHDIPSELRPFMMSKASNSPADNTGVSVIKPNNGFYGEAEWVAQDLEVYLSQGGASSDVAILYRANAQSALIEREFIMRQIRYSVRSGTGFYLRPEVYQMVFFLAVAYCNNIDALTGIPRSAKSSGFIGIGNIPTPGFGKPTRYLGKETLGMVRTLFKSAQATQDDPDLVDSIREAWDAIQDRRYKPGLQDLIEMLDGIRENAGDTPQEILTWVFEVIYEEHLRRDIDDDEMGYYDKVSNISVLIKLATEFQDVPSFVDYCLSCMSSPSQLVSNNAVAMMTVHASKGLEFKRVYVLGLNERYLPHARGDVNEERRIFYVAATRAEENLILVSPSGTDLSGKELTTSRFLAGDTLDPLTSP